MKQYIVHTLWATALIVLMFVLLVTLMNTGINVVRAGSIEADVIQEVLTPLWGDADWQAFDYEPLIADATEVYGDTASGNCATYAAVTVNYLTNLRDGFASPDRAWQLDAAVHTYWSLGQLNHLCASE
jgi:hypothetical protein